MRQETKATLIAARALITDPEYWTQCELAVGNMGESCNADDPDAYAFCALGALAHVRKVCVPAEDAYAASAACCLDNAAGSLFTAPRDYVFSMVSLVNDGELDELADLEPLEVHKRVLAMYDLAIELCGPTAD